MTIGEPRPDPARYSGPSYDYNQWRALNLNLGAEDRQNWDDNKGYAQNDAVAQIQSQQYIPADTSRDEELRLECLKLANYHNDGLERAKSYYNFVKGIK